MGINERGSWMTPNVVLNISFLCHCFIDKWLGSLVNDFAPNKPRKISLQRVLIHRISQNIISEDLLEAVKEL